MLLSRIPKGAAYNIWSKVFPTKIAIPDDQVLVNYGKFHGQQYKYQKFGVSVCFVRIVHRKSVLICIVMVVYLF